MTSNRKVATGLQLINWSRFTNVKMKFEGSTLITGNNGTGKSTVLDAITYLLTGNTHFNIAAKDRDRSVTAYVRGDTRSEGANRYLRGNMDVVSYIALEFYSPTDKAKMVVFVAIELKKDETKANSYWYVAKDASFSDIVFCDENEGKLSVYPKSQITVKGQHISSKEFMGMERGTKQVLQAMGLRCDVSKYKSKIIKMMSFDPQKNIDKFIQECVLEEGEMSSLADLKEQRAAKQPIDVPSAGSTFKRPDGHYAGKLIEDAGLKGKRLGGAQISDKHAGFIINANNASAKDILKLMIDTQKTVFERFHVKLEPEICFLGWK